MKSPLSLSFDDFFLFYLTWAEVESGGAMKKSGAINRLFIFRTFHCNMVSISASFYKKFTQFYPEGVTYYSPGLPKATLGMGVQEDRNLAHEH